MNTKLNPLTTLFTQRRLLWLASPLLVFMLAVVVIGVIHADVPGRIGVRGTVPLPGTQQQELGNITFPAPFNVFEFLVTCGACHGAQVDQQVAHFGNWAGSAMASASRDPVFRANEIIVNATIGNRINPDTGEPYGDGGGNMCFRCHSPNGWYSGRFDPALNGSGDGSQMLHSILLSTDDEGVPCEMCHKAMGAVTYQRPDLMALNPDDPVWNMLAGIDDWPHNGGPFVDQDGDPTIAAGNPLGNGTLQFAEGMLYLGRYPGIVDIYWGDTPLVEDPLGLGGFSPGGNYTGQTYGIYPPGWIDPQGNDVGGQPATGPNGDLLIQLDIPIGPPLNPNGTPNYNAQSVSPEHSTAMYPNAPPGKGFNQTSEFCGACHEQTTPVLNHGMPDQRTYTEWKYSAFSSGPGAKTCQDCHMPRLSHEYSDDVTGSYNADPLLIGPWPYAKPRTNTAVHKLAGSNRDLPEMMQALYPEVDIEVVGGGEGAGGVWVGTGNDPRIFPGMLSTRDSMWERSQRNTEVSLQDGVDVAISQPPTLVDPTGIWEVKVKVTNTSGHRLPSGFSDGQRMWIDLAVSGTGVSYRSGYYDGALAMLKTDPATDFKRALGPVIDATVLGGNAVMVYERVTGTCTDTNDPPDGILDNCDPSLGPLNEYILFDNRIPPMGFTYADYRLAGVKFWNYDPDTFVPYEEYNSATGQSTRYLNGRNWDEVTYRFTGPTDPLADLTARAEVQFQSHTREYMEFLRANDTSTVRPQGPPRPWEVNYPITPNYLSDEFGLAGVSDEIMAAGFISEPLRDNWGGIAYAAWYVSGKGAPYSVAVVDTAAALPGAVTGLHVFPECDPVTGVCTGGVTNPDTGVVEAYTQILTWDPVLGADGYLVSIKYGAGATASWDKLAVVLPDQVDVNGKVFLINTSINVNKTYIYKVQAFNGAGYGPASAELAAKTPWDLPLPPERLRFVSSTTSTITMSWDDVSDNEVGWNVFRQDVPDVGALGFQLAVTFPSTNVGGFVGVTFTDGAALPPGGTNPPGYIAPQPGHCYNYVVEAYNTAGNSGWNANGPVQMCTLGPPGAPGGLTALAVSGNRVDLTWTAASGIVDGYLVERATDAGFTLNLTPIPIPNPAATGHSDLGVSPDTTYWYRVFAYNAGGTSLASDPATVTTPPLPPAAPTGLTTTTPPSFPPRQVTLTWNDVATEANYVVERADGINPPDNAFGVLITLPQDSISHVDLTVQPKWAYTYRVRAVNAGGSSHSDVFVVTPGEIPEAPANLRVTRVTKNSVTIAWDDKSINEVGFYVERRNGTGAWTRVGDTPGPTFLNTGLKNNTVYWYRVQAYNLDGVSAYTAEAFAKTKK